MADMVMENRMLRAENTELKEKVDKYEEDIIRRANDATKAMDDQLKWILEMPKFHITVDNEEV